VKIKKDNILESLKLEKYQTFPTFSEAKTICDAITKNLHAELEQTWNKNLLAMENKVSTTLNLSQFILECFYIYGHSQILVVTPEMP
jgi:hypothetical protein